MMLRLLTEMKVGDLVKMKGGFKAWGTGLVVKELENDCYVIWSKIPATYRSTIKKNEPMFCRNFWLDVLNESR